MSLRAPSWDAPGGTGWTWAGNASSTQGLMRQIQAAASSGLRSSRRVAMPRASSATMQTWRSESVMKADRGAGGAWVSTNGRTWRMQPSISAGFTIRAESSEAEGCGRGSRAGRGRNATGFAAVGYANG